MNGVKSTFDFMTVENITSIHKNKGSKLDLENDRGIFLMTGFRKVLDKLTYNKLYESIENSMSDSNIGARRDQNIRNHSFVVHAVINSAIKRKQRIDIQIYDLVKAFDRLWIEDSCNDLYDSTHDFLKNDTLALIYKSNEKNLVAVKTPVGMSERIDIPLVIQQGGTWGPIVCSNSIDKVGKKCQQNKDLLYLYKGIVNILPLGMIMTCLVFLLVENNQL